MAQESRLIKSPCLVLSALLSLSTRTSERERIIRTYTELHAIRSVYLLTIGPKLGCFDAEACVPLSKPENYVQSPYSLNVTGVNTMSIYLEDPKTRIVERLKNTA